MVVSDDEAIQASMAASSASCQRSPIWVPRPVVAGRPRCFLAMSPTAFAMKYGYHKIGARGISRFGPGIESEIRQ
jgi:hypothetical protein